MKSSRKLGKSGTSPGLTAPNPKGEPKTEIPGVEVMRESKEKSKGFKKGGRIDGGAESVAADTTGPVKGRLDRPARKAAGGGVSLRGRSPLSAAAKTSAPSTHNTH